MKLDIVIAGIGGQGNVLISRILAHAAIKAGLHVRTSEAIGMAQRGGPVTSQVRMGDKLYGGIIPDRQADVIIGLELAEAVRVMPKLKKTGRVITSSTQVIPISVSMGLSTYDKEELLKYIKQQTKEPIIFDAVELARKAGNEKTANIVMLGAFSTLPFLPFSPDFLLESCLEIIPEKFHQVNTCAFKLGSSIQEVKS